MLKAFEEILESSAAQSPEEEILPFLTEKNHPALSMDPILG